MDTKSKNGSVSLRYQIDEPYRNNYELKVYVGDPGYLYKANNRKELEEIIEKILKTLNAPMMDLMYSKQENAVINEIIRLRRMGIRVKYKTTKDCVKVRDLVADLLKVDQDLEVVVCIGGKDIVVDDFCKGVNCNYQIFTPISAENWDDLVKWRDY
jgi:C-terminal processing protease CtpA/Prc